MKYYCVVFDELCRRKGVTANDVADAICVTRPTVKRWRRGEAIAVRNMNKLAAYFGVSIAELIGLAPLPEEK